MPYRASVVKEEESDAESIAQCKLIGGPFSNEGERDVECLMPGIVVNMGAIRIALHLAAPLNARMYLLGGNPIPRRRQISFGGAKV